MTRIFAQLRSGTLECPVCGTVNFFGTSKTGRNPNFGTAKPLRMRQERAHHGRSWDPLTQRIRCRGCDRRFVLGVLVRSLGHGVKRRPPPDTVPDLRQLAEMRREQAGGYWVEAPYTSSNDPVNEQDQIEDGEESV